MSDLRERILAAKDVGSERITVEEWGVEVEVRGLTGRARALLLQDALDGTSLNLGKAYPLMVIECTYDPETGERIFSSDDFDLVAGKSGSALEKIATTAARLSGLDGESVGRSKSKAQG